MAHADWTPALLHGMSGGGRAESPPPKSRSRNLTDARFGFIDQSLERRKGDLFVGIRLDKLELRRPRQWGACWLASVLYQKPDLDGFLRERLPARRKGIRWPC